MFPSKRFDNFSRCLGDAHHVGMQKKELSLQDGEGPKLGTSSCPAHDGARRVNNYYKTVLLCCTGV